jgi:hypothetical protein
MTTVKKNSKTEAFLTKARYYAAGLAAVNGSVTIDEVRSGFPPRTDEQQNAFRGLFNTKFFEATGNTVVSQRPTAKGRKIKEYRLV